MATGSVPFTTRPVTRITTWPSPTPSSPHAGTPMPKRRATATRSPTKRHMAAMMPRSASFGAFPVSAAPVRRSYPVDATPGQAEGSVASPVELETTAPGLRNRLERCPSVLWRLDLRQIHLCSGSQSGQRPIPIRAVRCRWATVAVESGPSTRARRRSSTVRMVRPAGVERPPLPWDAGGCSRYPSSIPRRCRVAGSARWRMSASGTTRRPAISRCSRPTTTCSDRSTQPVIAAR